MAATTAQRTDIGAGSAFLAALRRGAPLVGDGAMGTMLDAVLADGGLLGAKTLDYVVPEQLNQLAPERVLAVHRAYVAAGAQVIETNTFGGNAVKLAAAGLSDDWSPNEVGARLARRAADEATHRVWVAGSIGPTGAFLAPLGELPFSTARGTFAVQAAALSAGGADLLLIETMADLEETRAAILGVRDVTALPVLVTLTFEPHGRTMMGLAPEDAIRAIADLGVVAVGANCGQGPRSLLPILQQLHAARPDLPLIAQPNAGQPHLDGTNVRYDVGPTEIAAIAPEYVATGVRLLGTCCGSTPAYTVALAAALAAVPGPLA